MIAKLPALSADLIELLAKKYPDRCPDPEDSDRVIWMKAGQRKLVNELLASLNTKEDENLYPS